MNCKTPRLGVLAGDAPSGNMIAVVYHAETTVKWAYVAPGHKREHSLALERPQDFTPLSDFGVHATMNPDGSLGLYQITVSVATYHDGKARQWQGAQAAKIQINPRIGGYVIEAVRADFESRRAKAEAISA